MADLTVEEALAVADVRRMADELATGTYTDEAILALLAQAGTTAGAAARIWQSKAGSYASLVNVSEAGSSRSLSDLHKNALSMATYYEKLAKPVVVPVTAETFYPFTVQAERA